MAANMKAIKCMLVLAVVMTVAADCRAADKAVAREKTDKQLVVMGNNEFALELYAKLRGKEGNLFFSPYSISTALAMAYAVARGQTETQMAKVLNYPIIAKPGTEFSSTLIREKRRFASVFGKIIKDLNSKSKKGGYEADISWAYPDTGFSGRPSISIPNPRQPFRQHLIHRPGNESEFVRCQTATPFSKRNI
jgi:hypothetical protein